MNSGSDAVTTAGRADTDRTRGADILEKTVVVISVVLVATMLGFVTWQAVTTPEPAEPVASIETVDPMPGDTRQQVHVLIENKGGTGMTSLQVAVQCGNVERSLEFVHFPAGGRRTGVVVCPADTRPEIVVETWISA